MVGEHDIAIANGLGSFDEYRISVVKGGPHRLSFDQESQSPAEEIKEPVFPISFSESVYH